MLEGVPTVDVVLLSWRNSDKTIASLRALAANATDGTRVIVVDNGSDEGSDLVVWDELSRLWPDAVRVEQAEDHIDAGRLGERYVEALQCAGLGPQQRQRAVFVRSRRNRGYSGGMNLGLALAESHRPGAYFWLVCNDVVVRPGCIEALIARCEEDHTIGLCGVTQCIDPGGPTERTIPGGMRYRPALSWDVPVPFTGTTTPDRARVEQAMNCVQGSAVFGTRRFLCTVGPLLSDRFLYFEEAEWATRARRAGFRLGWAPDAVVRNQHPATMQQRHDGPTPAAERLRHELVHYLLARGAVLHTRRFHPWLLPTVVAARCGRALHEAVHKGPSVGWHSILGMVDGLRGTHRRFALLGTALLPTDIRRPTGQPVERPHDHLVSA